MTSKAAALKVRFGSLSSFPNSSFGTMAKRPSNPAVPLRSDRTPPTSVPVAANPGRGCREMLVFPASSAAALTATVLETRVVTVPSRELYMTSTMTSGVVVTLKEALYLPLPSAGSSRESPLTPSTL